MKQTRWLAPLLVLLLVAAACTRDEGDTATGDDDEAAATTDEGADTDGETAPDGDATSLDAGGFGDLEAVCQDGDPGEGADETGLSADEIRIGVFSDKGATVAPGLNVEIWDAAVAFAAWCNEHGGILGRSIVLEDLDVKLFEFEPRVTEACDRVFALVGGGAVFDDDPNDVRVGCDLPNVAGYVVSPRGRVADLQVQPVPNPIYSLRIGQYQRLAELHPEAVGAVGVMTGDLPATQLVRDQTVEAMETLGFDVVYNREYSSAGETSWRNFVQEMRDAEVRVLEFVGQPANLARLNRDMDTEGWYPDVIILQTNFYDEVYAEEAGAYAGPTLIHSQYHPYELASENKATQDYLDLMEQYNPGGKVALLGTQGISAWLIFARAATECGDDLTRACLMEQLEGIDDWTGGGLHAPQRPGNTEAAPCFLFLSVDEDGFHYEEEATAPTDGVFNCEDDNVIELERDYGVPRP